MRCNDTQTHVSHIPSGQRQHPQNLRSRKAPTLQAHRVIKGSKDGRTPRSLLYEDERQTEIKGHLVLKQNKGQKVYTKER